MLTLPADFYLLLNFVAGAFPRSGPNPPARWYPAAAFHFWICRILHALNFGGRGIGAEEDVRTHIVSLAVSFPLPPQRRVVGGGAADTKGPARKTTQPSMAAVVLGIRPLQGIRTTAIIGSVVSEKNQETGEHVSSFACIRHAIPTNMQCYMNPNTSFFSGWIGNKTRAKTLADGGLNVANQSTVFCSW